MAVATDAAAEQEKKEEVHPIIADDTVADFQALQQLLYDMGVRRLPKYWKRYPSSASNELVPEEGVTLTYWDYDTPLGTPL